MSRDRRNSEFLHLGLAMHLGQGMDVCMGMMTGYFDAGGHPDGKAAVVVGGYVSLMRKWLRFETQWQAALREVGIKDLHMTDFTACKHGFEAWTGREDEQGELWTPYALGGFFVMDRSIRWWGRKHPRDSCAFVFEDGDKHKKNSINSIDKVIAVTGAC